MEIVIIECAYKQDITCIRCHTMV